MRKFIRFLLFFIFSFGAHAAITPAAAPSGTVGVAYSTQMTTNLPSGGGGFFLWSADVLPPGLNLLQQGANNATISGTPTTAGSYPVTINVDNGDTILYTIVITASAAATSIPTLSEWGMIFLSSLIAMFGIAKVRRRN